MFKKQNREMKLNTWVSLAVVLIILMEAIISVGVIILTGTPKSLDLSAMNSLQNMTTTRGGLFETQIIEWGNIDRFYTKVDGALKACAYREGMDVSEFLRHESNREKYLNMITATVLDSLRQSGTTSCYVILDREDSVSLKDAMILRDLNPRDFSEDNSDVLVEAGTSSLMFDKGFTLDSLWQEHFTVTDSMDFYHEPYQAGNKHQELHAKDLGYYSNTTTFYENDISQICYSVPILDENHMSVGVMGYAVSLSYLQRSLPSTELGEDYNYTYCIGVKEEGSDEIKIQMTENAAFKLDLPIGKNFSIQNLNHSSIYEIIGTGERLYAALSNMRLYNSNTPFEHQRWYIIGVARGDCLFEASNKLMIAIGVAILISFVMSLFIALLAMHYLIKPIKMLMMGIESTDSMMEKGLPKTKIREFNELADLILKSNQKVYRMGGKLAKIIDLANLDLGVVEYEYGEEKAFCNRQMLEMLDVELKSWKDNYADRKELGIVLKSTRGHYTKIEDDVYRRDLDDGTITYFRVIFADSEESHVVIILDVTEDMKKRLKVQYERDFDVLTNLYNRRAFEKMTRDLIDDGNCINGVLVMWDMDRLKYVNDTYGHDVGDRYIKALGDLLKIVPWRKHVAARLSGDEFALFLYDREEEELLHIVRTLHEKISEIYLTLPDGKKLQVGASGGMARFSADGAGYNELIRYADFAMYEMKRHNKGKLKLFEKDAYIRDYLLIYGVGELTNIIANEKVKYAFQPIVSLKDHHIYAYEALLRPISDVFTRPDVLLEVAKEQAMNDRIERLTWFKALESFFGMVGDRDCLVFVNSIASQLLATEDIHKLEQIYGEKLSRVVMETTEQVQIHPEIEMKKRQWCDSWGMQMALDDFGSGYSNSDILVSGSYNLIKLDRTLVRNIHLSDSTRKLVESMVNYAHSRGIRVIAEGIEVQEELMTLKALEVDYGQGFYIARPDFKLLPGNEWDEDI